MPKAAFAVTSAYANLNWSWLEWLALDMNRHCERSAAIQTVCRFVDCRVAAHLAMTGGADLTQDALKV